MGALSKTWCKITPNWNWFQLIISHDHIIIWSEIRWYKSLLSGIVFAFVNKHSIAYLYLKMDPMIIESMMWSDRMIFNSEFYYFIFTHAKVLKFNITVNPNLVK